MDEPILVPEILGAPVVPEPAVPDGIIIPNWPDVIDLTRDAGALAAMESNGIRMQVNSVRKIIVNQNVTTGYRYILNDSFAATNGVIAVSGEDVASQAS